MSKEINVKEFIEKGLMKNPILNLYYKYGTIQEEQFKATLKGVWVKIDHEHVWIQAEAYGKLNSGRKVRAEWSWLLDWDTIDLESDDYKIEELEMEPNEE